MNILGIHYGHNATVCVLQDGAVTFLQSEERLNRIKNSTGFPTLTIDHIYKELLDPADVTAAVLFQETYVDPDVLRRQAFEPSGFGLDVTPATVDRIRRVPRAVNQLRWGVRARRNERQAVDPALREGQLAFFAEALSLPRERVSVANHHDNHAFAALPAMTGWDDGLVFTLDGSGDGQCATVQQWRGGSLRALSRDDHRHSLGLYYAYTTALLGMRPAEHEFKVMGLAPYADPARVEALVQRLRPLLRVDEDGHWRSADHGLAIAATLERAFRFQRFDTVAGAIQALTEELTLQWVRHWLAATGQHRLALGGGVFMNVKTVQRIAELPQVEELYVVPSSGDESCAIGAAVQGHLRHAPDVPLRPLGDLYLGTDITPADVRQALVTTNATDRYDIRDDVTNEEIAQLLADGEIVARCTGRMEYGARALGNRSIIADPSRPGVVEYINAMIKNRDFWMPFAPSVLTEDMARYFEPSHHTFAPYMSITFDTTPLAREHLAAAVHPRDKTARPQEVVKSWNPGYHELISAFKRRTGIGAVLNTSFNLHGEPNVCSPIDAIHTVDRSGLRFLVLGGTLLTKRVAP